MAVTAPVAGADGSLTALTGQRAALQAEVGHLSSSQAAALRQLLAVQDQLAELRRQLAGNQAQLSRLRTRHDELVGRVAEARARIATERTALAAVARQAYKSRTQMSPDQLFFGNSDLNQVLNRVMANRAMTDRAHALVVDLRAVESALNLQSAELTHRQAELNALQAALSGERATMLATAADYQRRLDALSTSSTELLSRINSLDTQIAAANRPPATSGHTPSQEEVIRIIRAAAARAGANGDQMVRVAECESSLNPRAYDPRSGASGLFQFMPGTFYAHGGHDIWDAADQSRVAAGMFANGQADQWGCR
ncbi:MAG: transglycosylase SLT domain-containing protein [Candidatus Dormibacteria bacterium]